MSLLPSEKNLQQIFRRRRRRQTAASCSAEKKVVISKLTTLETFATIIFVRKLPRTHRR